jgi:hypothetical protein
MAQMAWLTTEQDSKVIMAISLEIIIPIGMGVLISGPLTIYVKRKGYNKLKWERIPGVVIGHVEHDFCYYVLFKYYVNSERFEGKSEMGSGEFLGTYPVGAKIELGISPDGKTADIIDESYWYIHWVIFLFGLLFILMGISQIFSERHEKTDCHSSPPQEQE